MNRKRYNPKESVSDLKSLLMKLDTRSNDNKEKEQERVKSMYNRRNKEQIEYEQSPEYQELSQPQLELKDSLQYRINNLQGRMKPVFERQLLKQYDEINSQLEEEKRNRAYDYEGVRSVSDYKNFSDLFGSKRRSNKRKSNKRKSNKRRSNKHKSNKRKRNLNRKY